MEKVHSGFTNLEALTSELKDSFDDYNNSGKKPEEAPKNETTFEPAQKSFELVSTAQKDTFDDKLPARDKAFVQTQS